MFAGEKRHATTLKTKTFRLPQHRFWEHLLTLLVGHDNLNHRRLPSALERSVVVVDVGRQEEFGVEEKPLERREVGDLWPQDKSANHISRSFHIFLHNSPGGVGHLGLRC